MANPSPLRFGVIGTGMIAGIHAKAITEARGASLTGAFSRSPDRAEAFKQQHGLPCLVASIDEIVARPDIDVVCITTPSGAHLEPALAAIRAGKHVVVEKPIEATVERADALLEAAARAGVRVAPIFQARFGEGARAVKRALDAGRFGRLVLCSAYVKWRRAPQYYTGWKGTLKLDGGGAIMNQAIHAIDLLQWFAGMPSQVFAWSSRCVHTAIESEDTACASLRFPHGALGTIEGSTAVWPGWARKIEICGEHGSALLEDDHPARWDFDVPAPEDEAIRAAGADAAMRSGAGSPAISHVGHLRQIQDLVDAIDANRPLAIEGRDARRAVVLVRAIYDSAERGLPVTIA